MAVLLREISLLPADDGFPLLIEYIVVVGDGWVDIGETIAQTL